MDKDTEPVGTERWRRIQTVFHDALDVAARDPRMLKHLLDRGAQPDLKLAIDLGQLELARVKFRRGLADNFDLIEAETQLRRAQTGLVSSVVSYVVGTYRLRAALGKLVER